MIMNPAYLVGAVEHDVLALVDAHLERGVATQSRADEFEVASALVLRPFREEGAVDVAQVVVHRAAAAVPVRNLLGKCKELVSVYFPHNCAINNCYS